MKTIEKIIKKIDEYDDIVLFTHNNIDGDSLSSSYGLALAIKEKHPKKNVKVMTDLEYLFKNIPYFDYDKDILIDSIPGHIRGKYLGIVGDVAIKDRIQFFDCLDKADFKICFDHHQNTIDFDADIYWGEPNYPASSLQAVQIAKKMCGKLSSTSSLTLLFGILTDTGFFKYSTNNPLPVRLYADLIENISHEKMNELFIKMNTKTRDDLEIQGIIYRDLKIKNDVAYIVIKKELAEKHPYSKIKMKVNTISNIEGTHSWAMFIETIEKEDYKYKVSLRSGIKNVNQVAVKFGGGGHIKASGCVAKDDLEVDRIINELNKI